MNLLFLKALPLLAASLSLAEQTYLGFNSGATLASKDPKQQTDFEGEFHVAQKLQHSPGLFNSVRLYTNIQSGTTSNPLSAFPAAIATNTTMLLGLWCSGTEKITNELTALKAAIDKHGQQFADLVVGISVGSEDLYRVSKSGIENKAGVGKGPKEMVAFIKQVRDAIKDTPLKDKPVGHVDSWSAWSNTSNAAVIKAVDFVGTDLYPYYEKVHKNSFSNLTAVWEMIYKKTTAAAKKEDKPVWITETGWPHSGPKFGDAEASVANAKGFWDQVGCKLFGNTNVWWYTLRDSNPDNVEKFGVAKDVAGGTGATVFNLTCPKDSGAPASINNEEISSAGVRTVADWGYVAAFMGVGLVLAGI